MYNKILLQLGKLKLKLQNFNSFWKSEEYISWTTINYNKDINSYWTLMFTISYSLSKILKLK